MTSHDLFQSFGEDEFDKKAWVNTALAGLTRDESTDAHIANMAMKLQLLSQDLSVSTQTCMAQVAASMPRTVREIRHIDEQSRALRSEITVITRLLDGMAAADQIDRLQELDATHGNMSECAERLQQAAQWGKQVRDVERALSACERSVSIDSLAAIAQQLGALSASFAALAGMPGTAKRQQTLDRDMDRFESIVLPELVQRLNKTSTAEAGVAVRAAQPFVPIFRAVHRLRNLELQYAQSRQMRIAELWRAYDNEEFTSWLAEFYDDVLGIIGEEIEHAAALFGHSGSGSGSGSGSAAGDGAASVLDAAAVDRSVAVGSNLLFSMLAPLDREFTKRLEGSPLPEIADLLGISASFASSAAAHVPVHEREELMLVIGRPYAHYNTSYGVLEKKGLVQQLISMRVVDADVCGAIGEIHDGPLDLVSAVGDSIPLLFFELDAATGRCIALTAGTGAEGLISAATHAFTRFAEHAGRVASRVRALGELTARRTDASAASELHVKVKVAMEEEEEEEEDAADVFSHFDWAVVQSAFVVMQAAAMLRQRALQLDANFGAMLTNPAGALTALLFEANSSDGGGGSSSSADFSQCIAGKALRGDPGAQRRLTALVERAKSDGPDGSRGGFRVFSQFDGLCSRIFDDGYRLCYDAACSPVRQVLHGMSRKQLWAVHFDVSLTHDGAFAFLLLHSFMMLAIDSTSSISPTTANLLSCLLSLFRCAAELLFTSARLRHPRW
tara:strand:- start:193 stop:2385 length:2193 start_codon:yes stop_codon:yes gene_type:complete